MSRPPRGKRVIKLLDSLQDVYTSPDASPGEKLEAARLAQLILSGKRRTTGRRNRKPAVSKPLATGADLAPATLEPKPPSDVLRYFDNLEKK
jgi:hypothetical protein